MWGEPRPRVVIAGEALIDLIIGRDGSVTPAPGGGQYNAARALARLGGDVEFLGRIGDDWFGKLLRSKLEEDGVGTSLVVDTADPTTLVLAENRRGRRRALPLVHRTDDRAGPATR